MIFSISTRAAVIRTLYQIQIKHRRTYSQVKRVTIQKYVKKFYRINVCLSTISYHLWILNIAGIIRTYTRRGRNTDGTFYNLSSNRQITGTGLNYLKQLGINIAKWLYNWAFKGIKPKRYKDISDIPTHDNIINRLSRRSAGQFETLENALSDTLKHLS